MSVTSARGFVAAGLHCGIKPAGALDLALVATDDARPVAVAAVFTSNLAAAAPVQTSRAHLRTSGGFASAVVLNSGNANAATGDAGRHHSDRTCEVVADSLGCAPHHVLVCSTGLIGNPLPFDAIAGAADRLIAGLAPDRDGAERAATAILTTDSKRKEVVVAGDGFVVGGMAKGAAMLAPDMATMLAVLTTDAAVEPAILQATLSDAVSDSFNALSVDGCTSTNDTVILFGSGRAGSSPSRDDLAEVVAAACTDLAGQMAADAEGATKVVTVRVRGARSAEDARRAARKVAESQLVKCSLFGCDPYWGRVISELGSAGVEFVPERASIAYGGQTVCQAGVATGHDRAAVDDHLRGRNVEITADLGLGGGEAVIITNDLTPAYIAENMRTS